MLAAGASVKAEVVPPTPIETPQPTAPEMPVGPNKMIGPEGWMLVRYEIQADGSVTDVTVLDAVPQRIRTDDAVRTMQQWKYNPGTRDGTPIAWHGKVALITLFAKDWPDGQATPWFSEQFGRIQVSLDEKKPGLAAALSDMVFDQYQWRRYELGVALVQRAFIEIQLNNVTAADRAIRRVTHPDLKLLLPNEMKVALQYRFAISQALGDLADAVATAERRQAIEPLPAENGMMKKVADLQARLASAESLTVKGYIDSRPWVFEMPRRRFTISDVSGRIDGVNAYCDTGKVAIDYQQNTGWSLPEELGKCHVVVNGEANTTFRFVLGR
jgi:TonB family protein